jgi:hypothetical protein
LRSRLWLAQHHASDTHLTFSGALQRAPLGVQLRFVTHHD